MRTGITAQAGKTKNASSQKAAQKPTTTHQISHNVNRAKRKTQAKYNTPNRKPKRMQDKQAKQEASKQQSEPSLTVNNTPTKEKSQVIERDKKVFPLAYSEPQALINQAKKLRHNSSVPKQNLRNKIAFIFL